MNPDVLHLLESAGVGGVLAVVMFLFYRRDAQRSQQQIAELAGQYAALLNRVLELFETKH